MHGQPAPGQRGVSAAAWAAGFIVDYIPESVAGRPT